MSTLPNSPADDLASILDEQGVGTVGEDLIVGPVKLTTSNKHDVVIGLRDTPTDTAPNPAYGHDQPNVQVLVYSKDRTKRYECWQKAEEVKDTLLGTDPIAIQYNDDNGRQVGEVVSGFDDADVIYAAFIMEDEISSVVDDEEYMLLDFNFRLVREYNIGNRKPL